MQEARQTGNPDFRPTFFSAVNAAVFRRVPELSPPALDYIAQSYARMNDWAAGKGSPPFEVGNMSDPLDPALFNPERLSDRTSASAALAACLVVDIGVTWALKVNKSGHGVEDPRRTRQMGEVLIKGGVYDQLVRVWGERPLEEPDEPYSPKLVAYVAAFGVKDALNFKGRREYTDFLNTFRAE